MLSRMLLILITDDYYKIIKSKNKIRFLMIIKGIWKKKLKLFDMIFFLCKAIKKNYIYFYWPFVVFYSGLKNNI